VTLSGLEACFRLTSSLTAYWLIILYQQDYRPGLVCQAVHLIENRSKFRCRRLFYYKKRTIPQTV